MPTVLLLLLLSLQADSASMADERTCFLAALALAAGDLAELAGDACGLLKDPSRDAMRHASSSRVSRLPEQSWSS
jgi:hypothetical protein